AEELRASCAYLREQVAAAGRPREGGGLLGGYGIGIVGPGGDTARRPPEVPGGYLVGTAAQVVEQLKPVLDLGPTDAIFDCRTGSAAEVMETMERLSGDVWPCLVT
ncbi:MAG: hypothetical protein HY953_00475, partial [Candidatus Rokubacteria bacterium]|nr:hypothetical protein [Candidatus Rokubacteria bacterium]